MAEAKITNTGKYEATYTTAKGETRYVSAKTAEEALEAAAKAQAKEDAKKAKEEAKKAKEEAKAKQNAELDKQAEEARKVASESTNALKEKAASEKKAKEDAAAAEKQRQQEILDEYKDASQEEILAHNQKVGADLNNQLNDLREQNDANLAAGTAKPQETSYEVKPREQIEAETAERKKKEASSNTQNTQEKDIPTAEDVEEVVGQDGKVGEKEESSFTDASKEHSDAEALRKRRAEYTAFLDNNPNTIKYIFGKSGATKAERLMALGSLLASVGANAANGFAAGWNGREATPITDRYTQRFNTAAENADKRKQTGLDQASDPNSIRQQIQSYQEANKELEKQKNEAANITWKEYQDYVRGNKEAVQGVIKQYNQDYTNNSAGSSLGRNTNTSASAEVNGNANIPFLADAEGSASISRDVQKSFEAYYDRGWGNLESKDKDTIAAYMLDKSLMDEKAFKASKQAYVKLIQDSIQKQIDSNNEQIDYLKSLLNNNNAGINAAQGNETTPTNTPTTTETTPTNTKDGSSDVSLKNVKDATYYQNGLGYDGKSINKDFDYYLNRLRGE